MQDCISSLEEKSSWEKQHICWQKSVWNPFIVSPLEILLKNNNLLQFQGFTKWKPHSFCYSFPFLIFVENQVLQRDYFSYRRLINECSSPALLSGLFVHPLIYLLPQSVLTMWSSSFFIFVLCHSTYDCRGWHVDSWLTVTFNSSRIVQRVERQTVITSALKDNGRFMAHTNSGIIRDSQGHDLIVSVYWLACSTDDLVIQNVVMNVCSTAEVCLITSQCCGSSVSLPDLASTGWI